MPLDRLQYQLTPAVVRSVAFARRHAGEILAMWFSYYGLKRLEVEAAQARIAEFCVTVEHRPAPRDRARGGGRHPSTEGGTLHGDHAYVFYEVPADARALRLVFWPGAGQSSKTWVTTPDGREGFQ